MLFEYITSIRCICMYLDLGMTGANDIHIMFRLFAVADPFDTCAVPFALALGGRELAISLLSEAFVGSAQHLAFTNLLSKGRLSRYTVQILSQLEKHQIVA
jgi:hypothetical protein